MPRSAQAQAKLEAELALFSFDPATHQPMKEHLGANIHPVVPKLQNQANFEYSNRLVASLVFFEAWV